MHLSDPKTQALLERNGWEVECESPKEIRHSDGSFATGQAVNYVLIGLDREEIVIKAPCPQCQKENALRYSTENGDVVCTNDQCNYVLADGEETTIQLMEKLLKMLAEKVK
jgi:hypothetical protein